MAGTTQIYVNLPVASVEKSTTFFTSLGWTKNEIFSDSTASCIVVSPAVSLMLLGHDRYRGFLPPDGSRTIADAKSASEVIVALPMATRVAVDELLNKVGAAGGVVDVCKKLEIGDAMYGRSFADPDGHIFELDWLNHGLKTTEGKQ